jgi:hypothetical protein
VRGLGDEVSVAGIEKLGKRDCDKPNVGRSALNGFFQLFDSLSEPLHNLVLRQKPVIASDSDNHRYFKRLRVGKDRVVRESMDSGGDYAPVILEMPGNSSNCLELVWPVAGVLFELPY